MTTETLPIKTILDCQGHQVFVRQTIDEETNDPMKMWYQISENQVDWFEFYAYWFDGLVEVINTNFSPKTSLLKVAAFLNGMDIKSIQSANALESGWADPINQPSEFDKWLDTFVEEKGLNVDFIFEVEGPEWDTNFIPLAVLIENIKLANNYEQEEIKTMIVKIDFHNGDVMHFFNHLAKALAL